MDAFEDDKTRTLSLLIKYRSLLGQECFNSISFIQLRIDYYQAKDRSQRKEWKRLSLPKEMDTSCEIIIIVIPRLRRCVLDGFGPHDETGCVTRRALSWTPFMGTFTLKNVMSIWLNVVILTKYFAWSNKILVKAYDILRQFDKI